VGGKLTSGESHFIYFLFFVVYIMINQYVNFHSDFNM
jgi:hypothetical protein